LYGWRRAKSTVTSKRRLRNWSADDGTNDPDLRRSPRN
jgi:hypothetical protein